MNITKKNYFPNKKELLEKLSKLPRKNTTLKMVDFDDTIFSRFEQLNHTDKNSLLLQQNRGNKWNEIIKNIIGINDFSKQYYENKNFPKILINQLNPEQDLILTAGYKEIQKAKIKATNLEYLNLEIVLHGEEKPQKLIEYIIETLKYIPENVEIYEDRPQHFEVAKKEFEEITNSQLSIFFVQMKDNETEPKIKKLA